MTRVHRLKTLDLLSDIGTPDKGYRYSIALEGARVAHRFSANPTTVKQLISKHSEDIYFYCIPFNKAGMKDMRKLEKFGVLRNRVFSTKNLQHALLHNNAIKRPRLGIKCKVVMFLDKAPKAIKHRGKILYENRASRPLVMAVFDMSLHKNPNEARKINRAE